jgi:glycosyltransferase involved in cell wall biosynthesis
MDRRTTIVRLTDAKGGAEGVLDTIKHYLHHCLGESVSTVVVFKRSSIRDMLKIAKKVRGIIHSSDVIISSSIWTSSLLGLFLSMAHANPVVVARESTDVIKRYKGLALIKYKVLYFFYLKDFKIVAQTKEMSQNLKKVGIVSTVINNPYDFKNLRFGDLDMIKKLNEPYILAVGRLIGIKGFDLLIKAFYNQNNVKTLKIIGDGPELSNLKSEVSPKHLSHRVEFLGYKSNPYPYMAAASICVISSRMEGFPNTLLEMIELNGHVLCTKCVEGVVDIPVISTCDASVASLAQGLIDVFNRPPVSEALRHSYLKENHSIVHFIEKLNIYV